jgi:hypothetical protein
MNSNELMEALWCRDLDYREIDAWISYLNYEGLKYEGLKPSEEEYDKYCMVRDIEMDDYFATRNDEND